MSWESDAQRSLDSERTLHLIIVAGDTTCATVPGEFCSWSRRTHYGTRFMCGLFDQPLSDDANGWLARLPQCLAAEAQSRNRGQ